MKILELTITVVFRFPFFILGYCIGTIIGSLWYGFKGAWFDVKLILEEV